MLFLSRPLASIVSSVGFCVGLALGGCGDGYQPSIPASAMPDLGAPELSSSQSLDCSKPVTESALRSGADVCKAISMNPAPYGITCESPDGRSRQAEKIGRVSPWGLQPAGCEVTFWLETAPGKFAWTTLAFTSAEESCSDQRCAESGDCTFLTRDVVLRNVSPWASCILSYRQ